MRICDNSISHSFLASETSNEIGSNRSHARGGRVWGRHECSVRAKMTQAEEAWCVDGYGRVSDGLIPRTIPGWGGAAAGLCCPGGPIGKVG
jgi:hypothetical protein